MRRVGPLVKGMMMVMGDKHEQQLESMSSCMSGDANGTRRDAGMMTGGAESPPTSSTCTVGRERVSAALTWSTQGWPFRQTIVYVLSLHRI